MLSRPRVSVLMPAYNASQYLDEAINSILNQTFKDFEFIIINDGSTDNTAEIVKKYAKNDKRIKFINHSKNKGLIGVLNEGLKVASGEYIARMDSDDISLPERFAKQVAYMDKHPECGVLSTGFRMFGDHDEVFQHPAYVGVIDLLEKCAVAHPAVMIRKSVLDKHGFMYDVNYKHAEDYELWSRMIRVTQIHNLQEVLLNYRWHGTNVSTIHSTEQHNNSKRIQQNILDFLTANKKTQERLCSIAKGKFYKKVKFLGITIFRIKY